MKRKKSLLKNAFTEQPPLPEPRGLSSELNLDGLEQFLTEKSPKRQEATQPEKVKELKPNQVSFERAGLKVVEPKNISEIIDLLSQYVCDVEFTRVSPLSTIKDGKVFMQTLLKKLAMMLILTNLDRIHKLWQRQTTILTF